MEPSTKPQTLNVHAAVSHFFIVNGGLLLVALGIYLFKMPNAFVTGGVSGISIILARLVPWLSVGPAMTMVNIILVIIGFIFLGRSFGLWTIYSSLALSAMVWILDTIHHIPVPLTDDGLLELIFSIALPALGSAMVFNANASTGGTDILAKILNQRTPLNTGTALLVSDFIIALVALPVFGIKTGLYSILGLIMKAFLIDSVMEGLNVHKKMEIIVADPQPVLDFILNDLKRGATIFPATGAYSGKNWQVIQTVVGRRQAFKIRQFVRNHDPHAFMSITTSSEIIGKGFRN